MYKFRIKSGSLDCKGEITEEMGSYTYDHDSPHPNGELDNELSEIIQKLNKFKIIHGSLELFKVEPI